jgi:cyclopropane-fatty-acyl-phospholipid synthase
MIQSTPPSPSAGGEAYRRAQARKARHRFYPSTAFYTAGCTALLVTGLRSGRPGLAAASYAGGVVAWTLVEYLVHRYVLHGRFPDGPRLVQKFAHRYFDPLHWEHHKHPWDGEHISGRIQDTAPFSALFVALAFLAPLPTAPMFMAGLLQAYIVEEWVHHSVHYYHFGGAYFRYIQRHHRFHHSPVGENVAFGLTNGFWDAVFGTRIPPATRLALYRPARARALRAGAKL